VAESICDRIVIIHGGRIRASGTLAELHASAEAGASGLEELFLRLTGENAARELVQVLDA
jgi:ABC-2 type transport system ATP-binding protein